MMDIYKAQSCCNAPTQSSGFQIVPMPAKRLYSGDDASRPNTDNFEGVKKDEKKNYCASTKSKTVPAYDNKDCFKALVYDALEQSGTDVTKGYKGSFVTAKVPINTSYFVAGLCPVNVHWHLGTEHKSDGQYDKEPPSARRLGTTVDKGFECTWTGVTKDDTYTNEYAWQHCTNMKVGETYEVHWPHSKMGACGTPYQFQSPFYDGVFCTHLDADSRFDGDTSTSIGVQAQVF